MIAFIESLPVSSGPLAGTLFRLRPWQKRFIRAVYATDKSRRRIVRTAVLSLGRCNGKTTLAAMLGLCHLAGPEAESRGEVYSAANDRFQAARIFNEMAAIIERVPWLDDRVTVKRFTKELEDVGGTESIYAALSRESGTKMGMAPSVVIYDELGQTEGRDLLDALDTAMGKRAEPLMIVISTQASRDEAPLSTLIDYGLRIQRGEIADPSFHLTLYTAPEDADPWSSKTWKLANPALGDFRSLEDVQRLARQAQKMPAAEASFKNLILNMRCGTTSQFLSMSTWKACGGEVDLDSLKRRPCLEGDVLAQRDFGRPASLKHGGTCRARLWRLRIVSRIRSTGWLPNYRKVEPAMSGGHWVSRAASGRVADRPSRLQDSSDPRRSVSFHPNGR